MTRDEVLAIVKQAQEEGWEELDLSGRGLKELPEEIGRLLRMTPVFETIILPIRSM
jgi:internalin A